MRAETSGRLESVAAEAAARSGSLPTAMVVDADRRWPTRVASALPWIIVAVPAVFQLVLLATAISGRVGYPYDLEWMEGGMLHHAQRIHDGLGIYVPP